MKNFLLIAVIILVGFALFFLGKVIIGLQKLLNGGVLSFLTSTGRVESLQILLLITILLLLIILILIEIALFIPSRRKR